MLVSMKCLGFRSNYRSGRYIQPNEALGLEQVLVINYNDLGKRQVPVNKGGSVLNVGIG